MSRQWVVVMQKRVEKGYSRTRAPASQTSRRASAYRVFISHGSQDQWVASQIGRRIQEDCGAACFLDVHDIAKGDAFESVIFAELPKCDELVALLTPWSINRRWVWVEVGAARVLNKRIVGLLYGISLADFDSYRDGKACLGPTNIALLNEFDNYIRELQERARAY